MAIRLTKEEKAWIKKFQDLMWQCPSERLSAFSTGDNAINLYDARDERAITDLMDEKHLDFCQAVEELGSGVESISMPFPVHSTSG